MRFRLNKRALPHMSMVTIKQILVGFVLVVTLGACSSQGAREAEMAAQAAAQAEQDQEAARINQERERLAAAEQQRLRAVEAEERARLQAQRDRQAEEARMRADAERQQREAVEQRERARNAAIAAAEAERQEKIDRISELEAQIATLQQEARDDDGATVYLTEAVQVAEELLDALTSEQAKYENTDALGNTQDPLAKEMIADLEARKDDLVRRAAAR